MKRRVILIAVLAVGAAGGLYLVSRDAGKTMNTLRVSGNIEVTELDLSFQVPGRVIERVVSEGEPVRAGQFVARLDASELAKEVAAQRAGVMAAGAALAELEAGFRPEEIAEAIAGVDRARAEAERWRVELPRQRALFEKEIISSRELEASTSAYETADARLREAEERLKLLRKGHRAEQIEQARARLQEARESLGITETRLTYAQLASPIAGVVLSDNVEPGEYVGPGTPVVTVADVANVWLSAYINETDLGRVKLGQRADVTTDSYAGKRYPGRITFIASQAEFTPKNVQTEKERVKLVYRIKIDIANPDQQLKPGMPADAEILTAN